LAAEGDARESAASLKGPARDNRKAVRKNNPRHVGASGEHVSSQIGKPGAQRNVGQPRASVKRRPTNVNDAVGDRQARDTGLVLESGEVDPGDGQGVRRKIRDHAGDHRHHAIACAPPRDGCRVGRSPGIVERSLVVLGLDCRQVDEQCQQNPPGRASPLPPRKQLRFHRNHDTPGSQGKAAMSSTDSNGNQSLDLRLKGRPTRWIPPRPAPAKSMPS